MAPSFSDQFDQHGAWRRDFALRLKLFTEWLRDRDLLTDSVEERLRRLENQVRTDKVMVAFVAEYSRGKSELINAIFFAGYKRRIMPASAGRTTMCPTELGYDPQLPPSLRLLPIETRLQPQALMDWRNKPDKWMQVALDLKDPDQLASAMEKVSEVRLVPMEQARALGFWNDESPEDNPRVTSEGLVEVPRWRHALINIAHPLLKQGLVILDTPGLNAIGAEPELTVNLLPQAHAVVFILGADTGVTRSDLAIWRDHLSVDAEQVDSRLVVLNKIDTLWDPLTPPELVQEQIERQRATSAEILGLPADRVIPVSARKGLHAKIANDTDMLMQSQLPVLELALGQGMMGQRRRILRAAASTAVDELRVETGRAIHTRRRDMAEQLVELKGLRGKNAAVIRHMHARIAQEQTEFNQSGAKILAVRSVHLKLLREVMTILGEAHMREEMVELTRLLRQPGFKLGVKAAYAQTFKRLRGNIRQAQVMSNEIQSMLTSSFRQLNTEHGFSLQAPREPDLERFRHDLDLVERSHLQYLGITNILRLAQPEFVHRLVRALTARLRGIYESALSEVEMWNKSAASQLDAQLRDRRRNFARRIEAVDRIQQAAANLGERISDLENQQAGLETVTAKLMELTTHLLGSPLPHPTAMDPGTSAIAAPAPAAPSHTPLTLVVPHKKIA